MHCVPHHFFLFPQVFDLFPTDVLVCSYSWTFFSSLHFYSTLFKIRFTSSSHAEEVIIFFFLQQHASFDQHACGFSLGASEIEVSVNDVSTHRMQASGAIEF